jgi:bifunctional ADP-heptose synthase (sugar kinase/adenylyltransferase)
MLKPSSSSNEFQSIHPRKSLKLLLVGDSCYDYYHYGEVKRISPEAPIPIFDLKYTERKEGMSANVRENLKALGTEVHFQSRFGENKHRYIDLKSKHQLLRVDEKIAEAAGPNGIIYDLIHYHTYDAIVISDYDKGFVRYADIQKLRHDFKGPVFVDTKKRDLKSLGHCIFKINQTEFESIKTKPTGDLIVTYGGDRVVYNENKVFHPPKVNTYDVCGAGDTFLASLVVKFLETNSMHSAIDFAMKASAITVSKIGVYAPTREEIDNAT